MSGDPLRPCPRMVHVRTVTTPFHAQVIAARLGAEGILTEVRGNMGNGPYPFGNASVWVAADDADDAAELLMADEVESAFVLPEEDQEPCHRWLFLGRFTAHQVAAAAVLVLLLAATLLAHMSV